MISRPNCNHIAVTEHALQREIERLETFTNETRRYLDPTAEVFIPVFCFGAPNAVRMQLQAGNKAARTEFERMTKAE